MRTQDQDEEELSLGECLKICSLNVEGISKAKCEVLSRILNDEDVQVLFLQETHTKNNEDIQSRGLIEGFTLVSSIHSPVHGIATYVRDEIADYETVYCSDNSGVHIIATKICTVTVVNIYRPPSIPWPDNILTLFPHPCVYIGDFNSHHTDWGYDRSDWEGVSLSDWMNNNGLSLIFNAKNKKTFHSNVHNTETNPDLCFVSETFQQNNAAKISVLSNFPRSQHRPIIISLGSSIHIVRSLDKPRWNFLKANWDSFGEELDHVVQFIPPSIDNYQRFVNLLKSIARKHIPRGFRQCYIPGWNAESDKLFDEYKSTGHPDTANKLIESLDESRKLKWIKQTEELDSRKSSRKFWSTMRKFGTTNSNGNKERGHINVNRIASRLISNSKVDLDTGRLNSIKKQTKNTMKKLPVNSEFSSDFCLEELDNAISDLKCGKAAGFDGIFPEFIRNMKVVAKTWILKFFNDLLRKRRIPKEFKRAKVLAVIKPGKDGSDASHYRPISLLSVMYKLFERLLLNRINSKIEENLPKEQAGFRKNRNCTEQVLALTTNIENGFQKGLKSFVVFVDLTAAYDTVWREALLLKFMKIIPDRNLACILNEMLSNRYFQVQFNQDKSKLRRLNNGLPQGSVLAPMLFNIYTFDLPKMSSKAFLYADDLALLFQCHSFDEAESILNKDLCALSDYYYSWRLKINSTKSVISTFHLNNREANRCPKVVFGGLELKYDPCPKYLGIYLDRTLTFKQHLQKTALKVRTRNNMLYNLAGSTWEASPDVMRLSAISLVNSVADFGSSVWMYSKHVHLVDTQLNNTLRCVSGAVKATPLPWLSVLCNIVPAHLRRKSLLKNTLSNTNFHQNSLLFDVLQENVTERLKSRKVPRTQFNELNDFNCLEEWRNLWIDQSVFNHEFVIDPTKKLNGFDLHRKYWIALNRIRTCQGRCNYCLFKWNVADSPFCDCGQVDQTIPHIVLSCPLRSFVGSLHEICIFSSTRAKDWIFNLDIQL